MIETKMTSQMTSLRFIQLLESYGAQPARWPQDERDSAMAFAQKFEDAKTLLSEAGTLDAALSDNVAPAPSDILKARILRSAQAETTAPDITVTSKAKSLPLRAIAATLLVGIFVGLGSGYLSPQTSEDAPALYAEHAYDWLDEVFPSDLEQETP